MRYLAFVAVMYKMVVAVDSSEGDHAQDFAGYVVVYNAGCSARILSSITFFDEGGIAA